MDGVVAGGIQWGAIDQISHICRIGRHWESRTWGVGIWLNGTWVIDGIACLIHGGTIWKVAHIIRKNCPGQRRARSVWVGLDVLRMVDGIACSVHRCAIRKVANIIEVTKVRIGILTDCMLGLKPNISSTCPTSYWMMNPDKTTTNSCTCKMCSVSLTLTDSWLHVTTYPNLHTRNMGMAPWPNLGPFGTTVSYGFSWFFSSYPTHWMFLSLEACFVGQTALCWTLSFCTEYAKPAGWRTEAEMGAEKPVKAGGAAGDGDATVGIPQWWGAHKTLQGKP